MLRFFKSIFLVYILILAGCGPFKGELEPKAPLASKDKRYNFSISVYFPQGFENREEVISWSDAFGGEESYIYPIGKASKRIIEESLAQIFTRVSQVQEPAKFSKNNRLVPVIQVDFVDVQIFFGRPVPKSSFAEISYRFTLWNHYGKSLAVWRITGMAEQKSFPTLNRPPLYLTETIESCLVDMAEKLLESIELFPEVRKALKKYQKSPGSFRPNSYDMDKI